MRKRNKILACALAAAIFIATGVGAKVMATSETGDSTKQTDTETTKLTKTQEESLKKIKAAYDVKYQDKIAEELEEKKSSQEYTLSNMLIEYNPFGTNTQSLYVYFNTDEPVSVAYTVHAEDPKIQDFNRTVYQEEAYQKEHEFQVIGLIPDMENKVTFFLTEEDGSTDTKEIVFEMGSLMGTEDVQLDTDVAGDASQLEDGLYVVLGNDSTALDFMYYYDNNGTLRGEVPLLGYRSHRLIFDKDSMYYSISETKMAQVSRTGQVTNVFDLGDYEVHHDYVFDDNGNMLILASDKKQDSTEDVVVKLDVNSGEVTKVLDLGALFGEYKAECQRSEDGELDWMHINTILWMGNGSVLLSSRETSSIIRVNDIYGTPTLGYMIAEKSFWTGTQYESLVFAKDGEFTIHGGQHSVAYVEDDSLPEGQYYLYMFNNNIGISETRLDFDWAAVGLVQNSAKEGTSSYYYKYLVDENAGTFKLADSFEVPYSGYVSSAQDIGDNTVIDSGFQGMFGEYDKDHRLIASYKMDMEKFIYRVYKYDFDGFYFEDGIIGQ